MRVMLFEVIAWKIFANQEPHNNSKENDCVDSLFVKCICILLSTITNRRVIFLFKLYMKPLGESFCWYGVWNHEYAGDTQLARQGMMGCCCLEVIRAWMERKQL